MISSRTVHALCICLVFFAPSSPGELACVVVNPLQAFHPNKPPPSDLVLLSNSRAAGSQEDAYQKWLVKLAATCKACGVPLVYDEVYTGFRLAPGGAQDYYQVEADVVGMHL